MEFVLNLSDENSLFFVWLETLFSCTQFISSFNTIFLTFYLHCWDTTQHWLVCGAATLISICFERRWTSYNFQSVDGAFEKYLVTLGEGLDCCCSQTSHRCVSYAPQLSTQKHHTVLHAPAYFSEQSKCHGSEKSSHSRSPVNSAERDAGTACSAAVVVVTRDDHARLSHGKTCKIIKHEESRRFLQISAEKRGIIVRSMSCQRRRWGVELMIHTCQ